MVKALTLPAWEVSPLSGPWKPLDHETEEGMKSEDPHVYYFQPAGSFFGGPHPGWSRGNPRALPVCNAVHCFEANCCYEWFGVFILHNRLKTCRIHELDVGFGGFPCLFV